MPTMLTDEMKAMPQSVQPTLAAPPRKAPAKRTYQEDEINAFLSQDIISDFSELNSTHAPPGFQCIKSDNSIVFFNLTYVDGFPVIFESIKVDQSLHVQLQFNGHPVPLPAWFTKGRNATLTRFSQLNNFPNAIHCFAIMDYSYNIVQAHGVRDVRAVYTQIFDRFSPQIDICCSKHNNWGLKFAAKIVINTFFNNKQTVSSDSARKDTVVAFKKRQRTK